MIKMLVLDIDGTILSDKTPITTELKEYVKLLRNNGIKVLIATGRMLQSAKVIAKELGADDALISYQGALVTGSDYEVLDEKFLDENLAKEIISYLRGKPVHINAYIGDELLVEKKSQEVEDYVRGKYIEYTKIDSLDDIEHRKLNKLLGISYNKELIINMAEELNAIYKEKLYIVKSTPYFLEVSDPTATKGKAIEFLSGLWNIKKEEIMAVGDQDNDIEMLLAAGHKVAMANSSQGLKDVANFITKSVDENGVIHAINTFIDVKKLRSTDAV